VLLTRNCYSKDMGTFGVLKLGSKQWYTVELPWLNNEPLISCIPEGVYPIRPSIFKYKYPTYEIIVPGRSSIKFHIANTIDDLQGCVGIGAGFGIVNGKFAVINSTIAFHEFMKVMEIVAKSEDNKVIKIVKE
jgi:hypothetical protein